MAKLELVLCKIFGLRDPDLSATLGSLQQALVLYCRCT